MIDASTIILKAEDNWDRDMLAQTIRQKGDRKEPPPDVIDIASSANSNYQDSSGRQYSSSSVA